MTQNPDYDDDGTERLSIGPREVQRAFTSAMHEAVDFIHAEGWDQPPTLFGLVPRAALARATGEWYDDSEDELELTLVIQELPTLSSPRELEDYLSRVSWPPEVVGVILAQEIQFIPAGVTADRAQDATAEAASSQDLEEVLREGIDPEKLVPARLFCGVHRMAGEDHAVSLLQLRPTEEELAAEGPFADDKIQLRSGANIAPELEALLLYTLTPVEDDEDRWEIDDWH